MTEGLVYVAVILNGVTLVSPDTIPAEKCENLRKYNQSITFMCIDKEPDCGGGRASGNPACKGRVLDDPQPVWNKVRKARR